MLKWLVELRNFQFAELQAIPGGSKLLHIGVGTNLIPVLKSLIFDTSGEDFEKLKH